MHITANSLFRDTIHFLRSKWPIIVTFVLLSSTITVVIDSIITPNARSLLAFYQLDIKKYHSLLDFVRTLTIDQQKLLLYASIAKSFSLLIGSTFLLGNLITFIQMTSYKKNITLSIFNNIPYKTFFKLLQLIFTTTIITQLGFLLYFIPGFTTIILFSLSPIILLIEEKTILNSIYASINITLSNFKIIVPAIIFWLCFKIFIILIISYFKFFSDFLAYFILNLCINFISSILIIYLFRCYMILPKFLKN
ncbi:hypothetical protein bbp_256 [Buchnera aphidicola str. Bp (Baizongia pistaciae)]|uniref:UPF0259 membrane protein bbp_256 n=1 Tax=Buchnera aphidicola subsp. Baizongia pistaciae (strain Bp) TaxID=224915 RepID=Y256_BUCBP|nr:YciC family protein [Buchnera aphidicola]Q89AL2.1 RecName: Full=UPF0259 membrane protein bbp_256 [Buchnera aphidicola str. Bp (Baizongia pistaciae)]AAO26983.1 hypothetical protein bbp_256 [Buchnera aphidicola str. Bp (Baizongia pistaciae)]